MALAALRLAAERGPQAVTVAAIAAAIGAPTGSIYHRFESREELLAELWMEVVESFQAGFVERLGEADDLDGAVACATFMADWVREHALEARLLLLHRRQDFVAGAWPASLVERAAALEPALGAALRSFAKRAFKRADREVMARLRFALLDAPFGGIKPYVQSGKPIPQVLDELVTLTVRSVLGAIEA
jgi:AcrR family transcriptional regulator